MIPKKYITLWKQVLKTDNVAARDSLSLDYFINTMELYMNYYHKNKKDFSISKQEFFRIFVVHYREIPVQHGEPYGPSKSVISILSRASNIKILKSKTKQKTRKSNMKITEID
jgi:hypothetical protein